MEFLDDALEEFIEAHSSPESALLEQINRETNAKVLQPRMLSGHLQGRVLSMLSHMIKPKRILEIGTYTGYAAICMSEGLSPEGQLHSIDVNEELEDMIRANFKAAEKSKQLHFHLGNALEIIPQLEHEWDLVFIDADKENYSNYYHLLIEKMKSGSYLIADNVLWSGKVIEKSDELDEETKALVDYSKMVQADDRVENVLFPIRDGLQVARVK